MKQFKENILSSKNLIKKFHDKHKFPILVNLNTYKDIMYELLPGNLYFFMGLTNKEFNTLRMDFFNSLINIDFKVSYINTMSNEQTLFNNLLNINCDIDISNQLAIDEKFKVSIEPGVLKKEKILYM